MVRERRIEFVAGQRRSLGQTGHVHHRRRGRRLNSHKSRSDTASMLAAESAEPSSRRRIPGRWGTHNRQRARAAQFSRGQGIRGSVGPSRPASRSTQKVRAKVPVEPVQWGRRQCYVRFASARSRRAAWRAERLCRIAQPILTNSVCLSRLSFRERPGCNCRRHHSYSRRRISMFIDSSSS